MANTRLTVIVRKDLQMPAGLLAAQVCHMADAFLRKIITQNITKNIKQVTSQEQINWCKEPYLSVLGVNSYEDLIEIQEHACKEKLPQHEWQDVIPSPTFPDKNIKAFIGIAVGPADFDAIKIVTGGLELY